MESVYNQSSDVSFDLEDPLYDYGWGLSYWDEDEDEDVVEELAETEEVGDDEDDEDLVEELAETEEITDE